MRFGSLTLGYPSELRVRKVSFGKKPEHGAGRTTILFLSDLHLNRLNAKQVEGVIFETLDPHTFDWVLLGGDYCDDPQAIDPFSDFLQKLKRRSPNVIATLGNHDRFLEKWMGAPLWKTLFDREEIPTVKPSQILELSSDGSYTIGADPHGVSEPEKIRVVLTHEPSANLESLVSMKVDLLLSGHLHGGQCAVFYRDQKPYPQALFAKNCWLQHSLATPEHSLHIVNSIGVNDTLPIRWNCPRELVLVEMHRKGPRRDH